MENAEVQAGLSPVPLLAVELGVELSAEAGSLATLTLAGIFFVGSVYFLWRSFYRRRIPEHAPGRPGIMGAR